MQLKYCGVGDTRPPLFSPLFLTSLDTFSSPPVFTLLDFSSLKMAASSDDGMEADTLKLTVAALAISIAAILLSTLQALLAYLQFDNSEVGRRRCSEEVMGKLWAGRTTRKFKWREFRYQVFFEVPVFYTAPPE